MPPEIIIFRNQDGLDEIRGYFGERHPTLINPV
jgi:hypothetical protein